MYQSVGHHAVELYAEAMDLPLFRRTIEGASVSTGRDYQKTEDDEVEDLYKLLTEIQVECFPLILALSLLVVTCCLLITFPGSFDTDKDRQNFGPDLDPNCFTL